MNTNEFENIVDLEQQLHVKKIYPDEGMDEIRKKLKEKEAELEDLEAELKNSEALNTTLFVKERQSNSELQEARKELISVCFKFLSVHSFPYCVLKHKMRILLHESCIHAQKGTTFSEFSNEG